MLQTRLLIKRLKLNRLCNFVGRAFFVCQKIFLRFFSLILTKNGRISRKWIKSSLSLRTRSGGRDNESGERNTRLGSMFVHVAGVFTLLLLLSVVHGSEIDRGRITWLVYSCSVDLNECIEACKQPDRDQCEADFWGPWKEAVLAGDSDKADELVGTYGECYKNAKCTPDELTQCSDDYWDCLIENAPAGALD